MEITKSPLLEDVNKVIYRNDVTPVHYFWEMEIKIREPNDVELDEDTLSINEKDEFEKEGIFKPYIIKNIDFSRDYAKGVADDISIVATFSFGLWIKVLLPFKDYLEVTLIRKPKKELGLSSDIESDITSEVYHAVPKISNSSENELSKYDTYSRFEMDAMGLIDVEFQLIDLTFEKLRLIDIGGKFRQSSPTDILKAVLGKETADVKINDSAAVESIDIVEPDNKEMREHISVPHGLPLLEIAHHIQTKGGGLYNAGVNLYIQNKSIYVYPLFNTDRIDSENKVLQVIVVPTHMYSEVERTYLEDGDIVYVVANGDVSLKKRGQADLKNAGGGVRFADSRKFMSEDLIQTEDNKAVANRKELNSEYYFKETAGGTRAPVSKNGITLNTFHENSLLTARQGSLFSFVWRNSNPELLKPGMMVKIAYSKSNEVLELDGVLLKVATTVMLQGQGMTASKHLQTSSLFVYANIPE